MSGTVHAFDYLASPHEFVLSGVGVLFGDEPFLKRFVREQLLREVVAGDDDETPHSTFDGRTVSWRDIRDELSTVSLFGSDRRLVRIDDADDFVSKQRTALEDYVASPSRHGFLLLEVNTWSANTKLYKAVEKSGLQVACRVPERSSGKRKVPDEQRLKSWLMDWALSRHEIVLKPASTNLLLDLLGPEFGLLDQELAKLALFAGPGGKVEPEMIRDVVGGWRLKTTWDLVDAAADGDAAEALCQLDRLLEAGENPLALFGQIAWSLRRFAAAARIVEQAERMRRPASLPQALESAGFRKWPREAMEKAQRQLKQIGRERAGQLYGWLLDSDLKLKGSHSTPVRARLMLEQLFVRLSKEARPTRNRGITP